MAKERLSRPEKKRTGRETDASVVEEGVRREGIRMREGVVKVKFETSFTEVFDSLNLEKRWYF